MATSIASKIKSFEVVKDNEVPADVMEQLQQEAQPWDGVDRRRGGMESMARPDRLRGTTYKIKSPAVDSAIYITINDAILYEGMPEEHVRPFEIFFNSKNMEHYQWIVALTRVMSAVFRKGGDVNFLVEELRSVFDPKGGYWKKGGVFMPSLAAEIGEVLEQHLISIGMLKKEGLDEHQQKLVAEKRAQFAEKTATATATPEAEAEDSGYPAGATMCEKCHTKAVILMDGCKTCLSCGDSKCGT